MLQQLLTKKDMQRIALTFIFLACFIVTDSRWTQQQAQKWYEQYDWSAGFNYAPSYAVNQLQMWFTFDQNVIQRQLKWAKQIGFSKLRVFLHIGAYMLTPKIFLAKMETFVQIAKKYGHHIIPVLFDDCWKYDWQFGTQPKPIPGVHNSQWVQCPGAKNYGDQDLQQYVTNIMAYFKNDKTIIMWDLYNEVGNSGHKENSLPFLKQVFKWARDANTSQPLTSGHWNSQLAYEQINKYIFSESDVITFHAYCDVLCTKQAISRMKKYNRPVICTQYMARQLQSKFITHLPIFKQQKVWAINWGFVFGKTQTYYPWWSKQGDPVPLIWFHDVVNTDGTPFDANETAFIKEITSAKA